VGMGVNILYPIATLPYFRYNYIPWVVYGVLTITIVIVFISAELFYRVKIKKQGEKIRFVNGKIQRPEMDEYSPLFSNRSSSGLKEFGELPSYSWEDINQSILDGRLLVVANGKYVYAIDKWLDSHPG
jgi:hypothetical protein